jgi:predicted transcriptional regulator
MLRKCGFCQHIYEITNTQIQLENDDLPIKVIQSRDELLDVLPPDLFDEFVKLENKYQKTILYRNVLGNVTQKKIAEEMGITEHQLCRYLKNAVVKKILAFLNLQIIQENAIRENLRNSQLREKMYDWFDEIFDGKDNIMKEKVSKILTGISDNKTNTNITKKANKDLNSSLL